MVVAVERVTSGETSTARSGLLFGLAAYLLWGSMPVYFLLMHPAGAFEIVAWRVVFSLVFCVVLLAVTRGFGRFRGVLAIAGRSRSFALAGA